MHLSHTARELPTPGKLPSLVNRLRRFLNNPRVGVRDFYRPVARRLMSRFEGQCLRLIIDCTKLGFHYQLMTVAVAYRKRALPLAWSVHHGSKGGVAVDRQIALLRYASRLLPRKCTVWVLGDMVFNTCPCCAG